MRNLEMKFSKGGKRADFPYNPWIPTGVKLCMACLIIYVQTNESNFKSIQCYSWGREWTNTPMFVFPDWFKRLDGGIHINRKGSEIRFEQFHKWVFDSHRSLPFLAAPGWSIHSSQAAQNGCELEEGLSIVLHVESLSRRRASCLDPAFASTDWV